MRLGADAYVDKILTNVSLDYKNDEFIEDKLSPAVMVTKQSAKIFDYGSGSLKIYNDLKAPGAMGIITDTEVSQTDQYFLEKHRNGEYLPIEDLENADKPLNPRVDATMRLIQSMRLGKEKALADVLTASGTYSNTSALAGADRWDDPTSNPVEQIRDAITTVKNSSTKWANTVVMDYQVLNKLVLNPNVIAYFPGAPMVTTEMIIKNVQAIFGVPKLLVGMTQIDTANAGATMSLSSVWGKNVIICYTENSPTLHSRSLTFTYQRKAPRYVQRVGMGQSLELTQRDAEYIQVTDEYDQIVLDELCGYLYTTVIS